MPVPLLPCHRHGSWRVCYELVPSEPSEMEPNTRRRWLWLLGTGTVVAGSAYMLYRAWCVSPIAPYYAAAVLQHSHGIWTMRALRFARRVSRAPAPRRKEIERQEAEAALESRCCSWSPWRCTRSFLWCALRSLRAPVLRARALTFCASACTARIAYRLHVPRLRSSGGMGKIARRQRPPTPWCRACSRKRRC